MLSTSSLSSAAANQSIPAQAAPQAESPLAGEVSGSMWDVHLLANAFNNVVGKRNGSRSAPEGYVILVGAESVRTPVFRRPFPTRTLGLKFVYYMATNRYWDTLLFGIH